MATSSIRSGGFWGIRAEGERELERLRGDWGWFAVGGILLIVLGVIAAGVSVLSTIVSVMFLGVVLLIGGIVQVVHSFSTKGWSGFFLEIIGGVFYAIAGFFMMKNPAASAISITFLLAPL